MLTIREVADSLGLGIARIHQLRKEGKIRASKIGRDYFVERKDLHAFKKARKEHITANKAASILGVSCEWVTRLIEDGKLKATRKAWRYTVDADSLKALMKERRSKQSK